MDVPLCAHDEVRRVWAHSDSHVKLTAVQPGSSPVGAEACRVVAMLGDLQDVLVT